MKQIEKQRAIEIIELYVSYSDKQAELDRIALGSPNQDESVRGSGVSDVTSVKADKMSGIYINNDERNAYEAIMSLPVHIKPSLNVRLLVTMHGDLKKKHNSATKQLYTHADCAKALGLEEHRYHYCRDLALQVLIKSFEARSRLHQKARCSA